MIEPLRSRCLCIRVAAPSLEEVQHVLAVVAKREGLTLPEELGVRIAKARLPAVDCTHTRSCWHGFNTVMACTAEACHHQRAKGMVLLGYAAKGLACMGHGFLQTCLEACLRVMP